MCHCQAKYLVNGGIDWSVVVTDGRSAAPMVEEISEDFSEIRCCRRGLPASRAVRPRLTGLPPVPFCAVGAGPARVPEPGRAASHMAVRTSSTPVKALECQKNCNDSVPDGDEEVVDPLRDEFADRRVARVRDIGPGDRDKFEQFYSANFTRIYRYLIRLMAGQTALAEDAASETFLVAWRRIDEIPDPPQDKLWIYGVARNVASRVLRSETRKSRLLLRLSRERRWDESSLTCF